MTTYGPGSVVRYPYRKQEWPTVAEIETIYTSMADDGKFRYDCNWCGKRHSVVDGECSRCGGPNQQPRTRREDSGERHKMYNLAYGPHHVEQQELVKLEQVKLTAKSYSSAVMLICALALSIVCIVKLMIRLAS